MAYKPDKGAPTLVECRVQCKTSLWRLRLVKICQHKWKAGVFCYMKPVYGVLVQLRGANNMAQCQGVGGGGVA
jgi:hypothetical protein